MAMDPIERGLSEARAARQLPPPRERRRLREQAGVPQRVVAEAIGVRREAVCRYESGQRTPRGETLRRYARALSQLRAAAEAAEARVDRSASGRRVRSSCGTRRPA